MTDLPIGLFCIPGRPKISSEQSQNNDILRQSHIFQCYLASQICLNVARTGSYIVEQIVRQYDISRPFFPFCEIPPTAGLWWLTAFANDFDIL